MLRYSNAIHSLHFEFVYFPKSYVNSLIKVIKSFHQSLTELTSFYFAGISKQLSEKCQEVSDK